MPPLVTLPASPAVHRHDLPVLLATLLAGALFGLAQTLRGAHYPSHTLWSAWLCAALCVAAQRSATASAADSTSGAIALPISTIDATRSGS